MLHVDYFDFGKLDGDAYELRISAFGEWQNGKMARGLIILCLFALCPFAVLIHNFVSIYQSQVNHKKEFLDNNDAQTLG